MIQAARQEAANWARTLAMITNKLFRAIRRRFDCFPDNYLVLDLETTGLSQNDDLIGQIGICVVEDRKPVKVQGTVLNWLRHPGVDHAWLRKRLEDTKYGIEHDKYGQRNDRHYYLSLERLAAEGQDPVPSLALCLELLREARRDKKMVIAHNGYNFDMPFLENAFRRFLGAEWRFGDNEIFDTGMVEKASQLNLLPWQEESLRDYSKRVGRQRAKGVYWALDHHCVPRYNLDKKYGFDKNKMHEGGLDCLVAHYLFEEFRAQAESLDSSGPPTDKPPEAPVDPFPNV